MATPASFNGQSFSIPAVGDRRWGQNVTNLLISIAGNALAKSGGNFTLTADVNFGANFGISSKYIKSISSNIAQSGIIRLANNEGIGFRNAANSADLILKANASNQLEYNGSVVATVTGAEALTNKTLVDPIMQGQASSPSYSAGKVWYDTADQTLRYYNDSTTDSVNIGQEINVKIRNTSGSTILPGQVLRITGAVSSRPAVGLAQANAFATAKVFAVATETLANNTNGYATISGLIKNLDLSAFTVGDELYLSATVAGGLTNVRPVSPNFAQPIGVVADNSASTGRLIVDFGGRRAIGYGAANQMLGMNAAGTQPEYKTAQQTRTAILPSQASASGQVLTSNGTDVTWTSPLTNPMNAVGDLIIGGTSGAATRLGANITTTRQVLTQTGTGAAGQAPIWSDDVATATAYGRVKGGEVPGNNTGASIAAGKLGETVIANTAGGSLSSTSNFVNIQSISLNKGRWSITSIVDQDNAASNTGHTQAISVNSGNTTTDQVRGVNQVAFSCAANTSCGGSIPNYILDVTADNTIVYQKARAAGAVTTCAASLRAVRIG